MNIRTPLIVVGLAMMVPLSGCARSDAIPVGMTTTVTVTATPGATPPRSTDVMSAAHEWAGGPDGTGIFSVGSQPRDGLGAAIPPGRYTVRVAPGAEHGHWMVCETALCGPAFQENAAIIGNPIGTASSAMYLAPRARTLWVHDVVLSPIAD